MANTVYSILDKLTTPPKDGSSELYISLCKVAMPEISDLGNSCFSVGYFDEENNIVVFQVNISIVENTKVRMKLNLKDGSFQVQKAKIECNYEYWEQYFESDNTKSKVAYFFMIHQIYFEDMPQEELTRQKQGYFKIATFSDVLAVTTPENLPKFLVEFGMCISGYHKIKTDLSGLELPYIYWKDDDERTVQFNIERQQR